MTHSAILDWILNKRIIAVIRTPRLTPEQLSAIVDAITLGGISIIELTLTTPDTQEHLTRLTRRSDILVGVGTVMAPEALRDSHTAGAKFFASPIYTPETVTAAKELGIVSMPGAYTPGEVHAAWKGGADIIKLFPMPANGPAYLRSLHGPFPALKFAPSGGVTAETASEYIHAGAAVLNIGSRLTHGNDGELAPPERITERARKIVAAITPQ